MRIPLDYYRILGLPIQAPAEQLKQAHHDRTLQLPRREYSESAIAARQALLDEAYAILSDPEQRQAYDARFLTTNYDPDLIAAAGAASEGSSKLESATEPQTPHIEISEKHLIGALLLLQELGEYELVLKVGRPYLSSGNASLKNGQFGDPKVALADIVLTIALACLELGREQWQQGHYETAAEALETGQELLLHEGLFAGVRGEIQSDLLRLRPYRILELLALPDSKSLERKKGIVLLQNMLQERGGIDGSGDDQSGLSIDEFLRFVQQLRDYLSAEEQQALFEEESQRPSAVATYLAVYALLARGFAEQHPALIRRAKQMLVKLGSRQDVHLEQAVCALLLGQTEEASRVLELSQEHEPLAFIREQSQGSPDLLPGLCLYAERWLQEEVFPHFRDLRVRRVSLKDYFANEQVQAYLEDLPSEGEAAPQWGNNGHPWTSVRSTAILSMPARSGVSSEPVANPTEVSALATQTQASGLAPVDRGTTTSVVPRPEHVSGRNPASAPRAVREAPRAPKGAKSKARRSPSPASGAGVPRRSPQRGQPSRRLRYPAWLPWAVGLFLVGLLGFWVSRLLRPSSPVQPVATPSVSIAPSPSPSPTTVQGDLTLESAKQLLELWFAAKQAAMGSAHIVDQLSQVLAEPKLSEWQQNAEAARQDQTYVEYDHAVQVETVDRDPADPNRAIITASVRELSKTYQNNQSVGSPQTDDLRLRYTLVRQNNQWRISNWRLVP